MNDTITIPRATVQQVLGAIDLYQRNEHCEDELLIAGHFLRTALEQQQAEPVCWCRKCNENRLVNNIPFSMTRMILCPTCGNKRCPKASDHRLGCTDSNAAGQPGSAYPAPPQQQAEPVQEPFGYLWPTGSHPEFRFTQQKRDGADGMPLYTAPPQRKPLTDELEAAFKDGWQSAKAAHGIKEGT